LSSTGSFAVTVANVAPSTPVDTDGAANSVAENAASGTPVGLTVSSTDVNGPAVSYSLIDSAGGRFAIHPTTGVVTVANGSLLDYESATSHTVIVVASDGHLAAAATFVIAVTNVNEAPTATITGAPASSPEGSPISAGSSVSDPDAGDT